MGELAIPLMLAGSAVQVGGSIAAGNAQAAAGRAQQQAAYYEAEQMRRRAIQEQAVAQRSAGEQRRQARLVQSKALAHAAASGAGASDPDVVNIVGDLAQEGEYRALSDLFEGDVRAQDLNTAAVNRRYEGDALRYAGQLAKRQSRVKAFGTILETGASIAALKLTPSAGLGGGGQDASRGFGPSAV